MEIAKGQMALLTIRSLSPSSLLSYEAGNWSPLAGVPSPSGGKEAALTAWHPKLDFSGGFHGDFSALPELSVLLLVWAWLPSIQLLIALADHAKSTIWGLGLVLQEH